MRAITRKIRYLLWTLNGYIGKIISTETQYKVTVLITYYNPARMIYIENQVRNILKCAFVEKIVISNHNPDIQIEEKLKLVNERIVIINQPKRRGCGYRWSVAEMFDPKYLIVIDDDIHLFSWQIAELFKYLVNEPEIPHGISGMDKLENEGFEYFERDDRNVDYLCEVYAITGEQLKRYGELKKSITRSDAIAEYIESAADFMLIGNTGSQKPKIHKIGHIFRCSTFNEEGIAIHKDNDFGERMNEISRALSQINL